MHAYKGAIASIGENPLCSTKNMNLYQIFKTLCIIWSFLSIAQTSQAALVVLNASGVFDTSSLPLSGKSWSLELVYDTETLPDIQSTFSHENVSAISSFEITIDTDRYIGLNISSDSRFSSALTPVAGLEEIGGGDDRMEFRGSVFLDGDPTKDEIEIFEIVFEDNTGTSLNRPSIPGGFGLASDFDTADIDTFFLGVRETVNSGGVAISSSANISFANVPEPSRALLLLVASFSFILKRQKINRTN